MSHTLIYNTLIHLIINITNYVLIDIFNENFISISKRFKDGVEYNKLPEEDRERIVIDPNDFSLVINKANKK